MKYHSNAAVAKYILLTCSLVAGVTFLAVVTQVPAVSVYNAPPSTEQDNIAALASDIYNSQEFEAEMRAMAMARALYTYSSETQQRALEYAEMAQVSHSNSKKLAQQWLESQ